MQKSLRILKSSSSLPLVSHEISATPVNTRPHLEPKPESCPVLPVLSNCVIPPVSSLSASCPVSSRPALVSPYAGLRYPSPQSVVVPAGLPLASYESTPAFVNTHPSPPNPVLPPMWSSSGPCSMPPPRPMSMGPPAGIRYATPTGSYVPHDVTRG